MGAAAIPILLALGSAAASGINTSRTARRQDAATAEGIRRQAAEQRKATARLNESLAFFEKSSPDDIRENLSSRFRKQLRLKQQQALAGLDTAGGSSDAFKASAKSGGTEVLGRADVLQDLFSRIDAPTEQRTLEGFERGDLGSDLSVFSRNSAAEDYLTRLRVSGIRRNPLLDMLAAGLSGASTGTAGKFSVGKAGPTIAGSGGQSPQTFFNDLSAFNTIFNRRPVKGTPGRIFGS